MDVGVGRDPAVAAAVEGARKLEPQLALPRCDRDLLPLRRVLEPLRQLDEDLARRQLDLAGAVDVSVARAADLDVGPGVLHPARVYLLGMAVGGDGAPRGRAEGYARGARFAGVAVHDPAVHGGRLGFEHADVALGRRRERVRERAPRSRVLDPEDRGRRRRYLRDQPAAGPPLGRLAQAAVWIAQPGRAVELRGRVDAPDDAQIDVQAPALPPVGPGVWKRDLEAPQRQSAQRMLGAVKERHSANGEEVRPGGRQLERAHDGAGLRVRQGIDPEDRSARVLTRNGGLGVGPVERRSERGVEREIRRLEGGQCGCRHV